MIESRRKYDKNLYLTEVTIKLDTFNRNNEVALISQKTYFKTWSRMLFDQFRATCHREILFVQVCWCLSPPARYLHFAKVGVNER